MSTLNSFNFLPADYLLQKRRRRMRLLSAIGLTVAAGLVGSGMLGVEWSLRNVERRHAAISREYADSIRRIEQSRQSDEIQRRALRRQEAIESLQQRVPRNRIVTDLNSNLPDGATLLNVTLDSEQRSTPAPAAATAFDMKRAAMEAQRTPEISDLSQPDVTITLTGTAESDLQVAAYLHRLGHSPLFKSVRLLLSETSSTAGTNTRRFQIEMTLNPDAVITPAAATTTAATELSD